MLLVVAVAVNNAGAGLVADPKWEHVPEPNNPAGPEWEEDRAARCASARLKGGKVCRAEAWADGARVCRAEVMETDTLDATHRGKGGFGHSGIR